MDKKTADIVRFFMHNKVQGSSRAKFLAWLMADSGAEAKDKALQDEWMSIPDECPDRSVYRSWNQVRSKAGLESERVHAVAWRRVAGVAAMWLVLIVSGALVGRYLFPAGAVAELRQYSVAPGQKGLFELPDGTRVMANAGTTIVYPDRFDGDTRTVYLSGEANFDVHPDREHPFIVKTPMLAIQALGTKFNVQAYLEDRMSLTTLESGKVRVTSLSDPERRFILRPDEQLAYDQLTHTFKLHTVDVSAVSGWMDGELNFINCPVDNILTVMERHYGVEIKVDPEIFTNDLYNIRLKQDEPLDNAMRIVSMTIGGTEWHTTPDGDIVLMSSTSASKTRKGGARQ